MVPYYLLLSPDFNPKNITNLSSNSQIGLDSVSDDTPYSSIRKSTAKGIRGFTEYELVTETLKRQKGRAYGKPDIFKNFILIKEDVMYYNKTNNLLILSTSKDNFHRFIKRFDKNDKFAFQTVPVDFSAIIDNALNLGTDGVWLGELGSTNINAVGLMGHRVQDSTEYQQYIDTGAVITNISFVYDYKGTQEKIMISRDGGIILYQSKPRKDALALILDVYKKMLLSN